ncbi:MAG: ribosome biogenesis GTPase Der [Deltaproteobacteria bacterium]|nr:ribosome biogenesis GTPase Der [Deltaproteobacteria bacterium]
MTKPIVAVIGRPNVGKSTLFNRIIGKPLAIVHNQPGVTRDRHYADANVYGRAYTLIDTGGFDPGGEDEMKHGIIRQLEAAIAEADVILCVLDATAPPSSVDSEEVALLRRTNKPVIYLANKADTAREETLSNDLYRLGMERLIPVSAIHGRGFDELERALSDVLPPEAEPEPAEDEADKPLAIAVIGKPNAGKSSLINRLLGEERLLTDSRPGTTRDTIDTLVERNGRRYLFVDTAGLRRKSKVVKAADTVEAISVMRAIRAIDRAEVVVLLFDAAEGVAEQDAKILGLAVDRGRAIVVGLNKIDLLDREAQKKAEERARDVLAFASWAEMASLSAKTGRGIDRMLKVIDGVAGCFRMRIKTAELNRFFDTVLMTHPPPTMGGRAPRFYFITQAAVAPPTFAISTNHPEYIHFSYQRYVSNAIRKQFGFKGVPLRVYYRAKKQKT